MEQADREKEITIEHLADIDRYLGLNKPTSTNPDQAGERVAADAGALPRAQHEDLAADGGLPGGPQVSRYRAAKDVTFPLDQECNLWR